MRIAALVVGIIGGIIGLLSAGVGIAVVGIGPAYAAFGLSILGIVGGALALAKPKLAGMLMLIGGIGLPLVFPPYIYIFSGPLLLIGGILALTARAGSKTERRSPT